jgi:hypothetical protein
MPVRIIEDIVRGTQYRVGRDGGIYTRVFYVTGLDPTAAAAQRMSDAAQATDATTGNTIPAYGAAHPTIDGAFASQIDAEPLAAARDKARVAVLYSSTPALGASDAGTNLLVRINGIVTETYTSLDVNGTLLRVGHVPGASPGSAPDPSDPNRKDDVARVRVLEPDTLLEIVRNEDANPLANSLQYRRQLNSETWQGMPARTWLCVGLSGERIGRIGLARQWRVTYAFQYRALPPDGVGWDALAVFTDYRTNRPPADVDVAAGGFPGNTSGNGFMQYQIYGAADFSGLGLPDVATL